MKIQFDLSKDGAFNVACMVQYAINHNPEFEHCRQTGIDFIAQAVRLSSEEESAIRVDLPAMPSVLLPALN